MNNENFSELSLDEIQLRLSTIDSDRAALERALDRKKQQDKKDLAQEIRGIIEERGYEVGDIVELIGPRKRSSGRGKSNRAYKCYVDPANENNVYIRGVLPKWMKEQMAAKGLDPSNKEDRDNFKKKYLNKVES